MLIKQADLERDREELIQVLLQYLTEGSSPRRYDWLYLQNPAGRAKAWLAEENGEIVGAAAAFPRQMSVHGREGIGCVLGDFCMAPRLRSVGPAIKLQRACLEAVEPQWAALAYDFPSTSLMAVYRRLGFHAYASFVRLAKPLRTNRAFQQRIPVRPVANALSVLGNLALRLRDVPAENDSDSEVALHAGPCAEEFTALARRESAAFGVCVLRSAEYLNWRFLSNPFSPFEIWTHRRKRQLTGYAIVGFHEDHATLADLFGERDLRMVRNLIAHIGPALRERGIMTLSAHMVPTHPFFPVLQLLGFRPRESTPVVVFEGGPNGGMWSERTREQSWSLMAGDRDS